MSPLFWCRRVRLGRLFVALVCNPDLERGRFVHVDRARGIGLFITGHWGLYWLNVDWA